MRHLDTQANYDLFPPGPCGLPASSQIFYYSKQVANVHCVIGDDDDVASLPNSRKLSLATKVSAIPSRGCTVKTSVNIDFPCDLPCPSTVAGLLSRFSLPSVSTGIIQQATRRQRLLMLP